VSHAAGGHGDEAATDWTCRDLAGIFSTCLGGIIGGALGTGIGIRPTLWVAVIGSWAAGFWVFFSPLRHMRDVPQVEESAM
jgi:predicted MFS family arabinose efflux permease